MEKQSFAKLHFLRAIEEESQKKWEEEKVFEYDAPSDPTQPKYLGTFPYPYMNGRPHLGHTFTLTKVEFAVQHQRLKGKNGLFPFGFHCTGMPIKAAADKLKRNLEEFGNPPVFPEEEEDKAEGSQESQSKTKTDPLSFRSQKSKVKSKGGGGVYQWHIMKSLGIPEEEIPKFADAHYWLEYFPVHCKDDLVKMGLGVDWRRSFITTDVNPYYDSFVRWQFETLREKGKVLFGKRNAVWSPKDGQPCADHDRSTGEGVLPQEYVLIKLELISPFPEKLSSLEGKKVYLVPGTLRPETMYGQTNCWVLPDGNYGAFEINETEVFICTERAARNMCHQNLSKKFGEYKCLVNLKGWDILGIPLKAPLSYYPVIYTLPMLTILETKGTGIVTSVPSDSPDDYVNLRELNKKPAFREKFGIKDHMVVPYEVIPIIAIPEVGNESAKTICDQLKINSPGEKEKLEQAKAQVYEKGFYQGTMIVGKYKGRPVSEAKPLIKQAMIDANQAVIYNEPESLVISRSGDECVVALTDQWYIDYGEEKWRTQVEEHLKNMELYSPECRHKFEKALEWMNQWACSRTYGLGTRLPFDEQFLIESLSDSTIYMAFYTVAHLLQGGVIDGSKVGPGGIKPEKMTKKVWDFIFLNGEYSDDFGIPKGTLDQMKKEFEYWYPVDLRVSGKDLITNHLVFFLYNHLTFFPKEKLPKAIRANGHILLDGEKMSKNTGNFITLSDAVDRYSADAMRITLADGSDSLNDANFETKSADKLVERLWKEIKWVEEELQNKNLRKDSSTFFDLLFESQMNFLIEETDRHYERTNFREALKSGFFDLQTARDFYRANSGKDKMREDLIQRFIEVQALLLSPIAPHITEYIWKLLGRSGSIRRASWPASGSIDQTILKQGEYYKSILEDINKRKELSIKPKKGVKAPPPKKVSIFVAKEYPEWQVKAMEVIRSLCKFDGKKFDIPDKRTLVETLSSNSFLKKLMPKVMPFVSNQLSVELPVRGPKALETTTSFDELKFISEVIPYIKEFTGLECNVFEAEQSMLDQDRCFPEKPLILVQSQFFQETLSSNPAFSLQSSSLFHQMYENEQDYQIHKRDSKGAQDIARKLH